MKIKSLFATGLLCFALASANQAVADEEEGCDKLGQVVSAVMFALGTQGGTDPALYVPAAILAVLGGSTTQEACDVTTEAVAEAYEEALRQVGIEIMWWRYTGGPSPKCLHIDPNACTRPTPVGPNPWTYMFVYDTWAAIQNSVVDLMPGGAHYLREGQLPGGEFKDRLNDRLGSRKNEYNNSQAPNHSH